MLCCFVVVVIVFSLCDHGFILLNRFLQHVKCDYIHVLQLATLLFEFTILFSHLIFSDSMPCMIYGSLQLGTVVSICFYTVFCKSRFHFLDFKDFHILSSLVQLKTSNFWVKLYPCSDMRSDYTVR